MGENGSTEPHNDFVLPSDQTRAEAHTINNRDEIVNIGPVSSPVGEHGIESRVEEPEASATSDEATLSPETNKRKCTKSLRAFLSKLKASFIRFHLLWLLTIGVLIGIVWPTPGEAMANVNFQPGLCFAKNDTNGSSNSNQTICVWTTFPSLFVSLIFLISGLQLKVDKMREALGKRRAIVIGLFLVLVATTSTGYAIAAGPKLNPVEFSLGLALFALMPTTLSACVVIVGYCDGDTALALLLTVVTNMLGVAVLPVTVSWMVGIFRSTGSQAVGLNQLNLFANLVFNVFVPLFLGIGITRPRTVRQWVQKSELFLKISSAVFLSAIPWMSISKSSDEFGKVSGASYAIFLVTALFMHVYFLALSLFFCRLTLDWRDQSTIKAVTIVSGQKSFPISLTVLAALPSDLVPNVGLSSLALVILQLIQTFTDSTLALRWPSAKVVEA